MTDIEALFEAGQFQSVVTHLEGWTKSARDDRWLGIALIRVGRIEEAEISLTRAAMQGDHEGQVELGNALRLLGRFDEAIRHFEGIAPDLAGELQLRAWRWWGVAEFKTGHTKEGLLRMERAWHGYLALGDSELSARVTTSLAQMYRDLGDDERAKTLLSEAVHALPLDPFPGPRVSALRQLLELHLTRGEFTEAHEVLAEAKRALYGVYAPRMTALLFTSEAELARLTGETQLYQVMLEALRPLAEHLADHDLRLWTVSRLAEHHSLHGQHGQAMAVLLGYGLKPEEWPAELLATCGVLERRRGELLSAENHLLQAAALFRASGRVPELCRVQLHSAATYLQMGGEQVRERVVPALNEAITHLLRLRHLTEFKPDFEELNELLHYALLEPDTAPLMEPLLERLAHLHLAGMARRPEDGDLQVSVKTLGRMAIFKDALEVPFSRTGCVTLLVYLTLQPGRTRAQMQYDLWPDKEPATGSAYIRQCLKELRDKLGHDLIRSQGPQHAPHYVLGPLVHVDLDITPFLEAIQRKETARALALYRGEFLPHADPCPWVDTQRESLLLSLTLELHFQMKQAQQDGDHRRVVLLANQALRIDPQDQQVLEDRVAAARQVASPQELAYYTAELLRYHYKGLT